MNFARVHGFSSAAEHIVERIQKGNYPVHYSYRFIELLLRVREFEIAGKVIKALDDIGTSNPLIDKVKGIQLWGVGKHKEAIEFSIKAALHWSAPFIYYEVSKFLARKGQQDESRYYFGIAVALAKKRDEDREKGIPPPYAPKKAKSAEPEPMPPFGGTLPKLGTGR